MDGGGIVCDGLERVMMRAGDGWLHLPCKHKPGSVLVFPCAVRPLIKK
jgi:hypothetical protein